MFMAIFSKAEPLTITFSSELGLKRLNKSSTYIPTILLHTTPGRNTQNNTQVTRFLLQPLKWYQKALQQRGEDESPGAVAPIEPCQSLITYKYEALLKWSWQDRNKCSEKTCHSATLFTMNSMCTTLGMNLSLHGKKLVNNCQRYGQVLAWPVC
jgi:hypothetical protein